MYSSIFAYDGFDVLNFGTEEIDSPRRTLPIAIFAGISISAVVYISMNLAYFSILTVDEFQASDTVAVVSICLRHTFDWETFRISLKKL